MRKTITTLALALGLVAPAANADQKTLSAIEKAGVTLTSAEISALKDIKCVPQKDDTDEISSSCQSLVDQVAALVAAYAADDAAVESILKGAVEAHPELANAIGDASIAAAPQAVAVIAGIMTEIAPTAAGRTPPGIAVARAVANANNNIPTPPGGGGSSSPN